MTDVKGPVADAKETSQAIACRSEENVAELRDSNSELAHRTGDEEKNVLGAVTTRCKVAVSTVSDYVERRPWQAVGVAAGVGMLTGLLLNSR